MAKDDEMRAYGKFLEGVCRGVAELKPACIAVATINRDGTTACFYFGCEAVDKAFLSAVIQQDGLMDRIVNNKEWLREAMESEEEDG